VAVTKKSISKLRYSHTKEIIEDGKLTKQEYQTCIAVPKEEIYMKTFLSSLSKIFGVSGNELSLFVAIAAKANWNTNIFDNNYTNKKEICDLLKIKEQTYKNGLAALVRTGGLKNIKRGLYFVNPEVFARGEWLDILKQREDFKVTLNFSKKHDPIVEINAV
jgi:hypothetical protein